MLRTVNIYTVSQKTGHGKVMPHNSQILTSVNNSFTSAFSDEVQIKMV